MGRYGPIVARALRAALAAAFAACVLLSPGAGVAHASPTAPQPPAPPTAPRAPAAAEGAQAAGVREARAGNEDEGDSLDDEDEGDLHGKGDVNLHQDVTVDAGQVRERDLVVIDGDVEIHGEVRGDVVVVHGSLDIDGKVSGDTVALLTDTTLGETAVIGGDFVQLGGDLDISPRATVRGERFHWGLSNLAGEAAKSAAGGILRLIYIARLLVFALFFWAMLIAICVSPRQITAAGEALGKVWGRTLFMGLLAYAAYFVLFFIFLLLSLALIGIPLIALLIVAWFATQAVGLAAILWLAGDRISRNLLRREALPIVAFLIGFALYLPTQVVPFHLGLGWLAFALFGGLLNTCLCVVGVGLALVTQFGRVTQFPPPRPAFAGVDAPPSPPPPPPGQI